MTMTLSRPSSRLPLVAVDPHLVSRMFKLVAQPINTAPYWPAISQLTVMIAAPRPAAMAIAPRSTAPRPATMANTPRPEGHLPVTMAADRLLLFFNCQRGNIISIAVSSNFESS